jgi:putative FmdB family regulatory protein
MPLYEYRCAKCAETFEVMRKFSDPPLIEHEGCGGVLERLLSAPAFQLKGTGWYATDYAKSGAKATAPDPEGKAEDSKKADSKDSQSKAEENKSSGDKPADSKSETKPDPKPAPAASKGD